MAAKKRGFVKYFISYEGCCGCGVCSGIEKKAMIWIISAMNMMMNPMSMTVSTEPMRFISAAVLNRPIFKLDATELKLFLTNMAETTPKTQTSNNGISTAWMIWKMDAGSSKVGGLPPVIKLGISKREKMLTSSVTPPITNPIITKTNAMR